MSSRLVRMIAIWAPALGTVWVGERFYLLYFWQPEAPRIVIPAGKLSDGERVAAQIGVRGVVIVGVAPGSPAQKAGLPPFEPDRKPVGDIIVAIDSKATHTVGDLVEALDEAGSGNEARVTIKHGASERDVKVRILDLGD